MKESDFEKKLKAEIKKRFPECIIYKTNPRRRQGEPDLLILNRSTWASLEVKNDEKADHRPNQDFRVEKMNKMSYSSFIYPQNKEEVLNDLERKFQS